VRDVMHELEDMSGRIDGMVETISGLVRQLEHATEPTIVQRVSSGFDAIASDVEDLSERVTRFASVVQHVAGEPGRRRSQQMAASAQELVEGARGLRELVLQLSV
jgi:methyl-accepting chemotaxis protein